MVVFIFHFDIPSFIGIGGGRLAWEISYLFDSLVLYIIVSRIQFNHDSASFIMSYTMV